jgi:GT2 family glycosyltransferase
MSPPAVTAIVLNWCGEAVTADCIRSLLASNYRALEVLLVDNGSTDDSFERLKESFPNIEFLQTGENLGYAGGNNRGIEWALAGRPKYVLILNNDTVLDPDTVSKLVYAAENREVRVGGVVPKILYYDDPTRIWYAGGEFSSIKGLGIHWEEGGSDRPDEEENPRDVTFMTGACCLLSAESLRELKGFDEDFFAYVEDADLSLRMRQAGYRMYYQPKARVLHHCSLPGTPPSAFQIRQRDLNRRRIMRKHASPRERLPFLARFYVTRAILLLGYVLKRDWTRAQAILQGMGKG